MTDAFDAGANLARQHHEDYHAIGRAGALLVMLKHHSPERFKKWEIMKAEGKYVVREARLFRSKAISGFTPGRMVEIEKQLRSALEALVGPISDAELDEAVTAIELSPITSRI